MPSSRAAWRRIIVMRSSRSPPCETSTSGISPKPISSSIGSYESSGTTDSAGFIAVCVPPATPGAPGWPATAFAPVPPAAAALFTALRRRR